MANRIHRGRVTRQRGAVLVVSLLLLLVMTLLGLGASQSTRMQERMAGNQRDLELAMQGAEAGLRAAEDLLPSNRPISLCSTNGSDCDAFVENTLVDGSRIALDLSRQSNDWWTTWSKEHPANSTLGLQRPPQFVSERVARMRDTLSEGDPNIKVVREYYRVTSRSRGLTDSAQVVVQSTYGRVTFE
jgi:type IV pilus assembly protein PilX